MAKKRCLMDKRLVEYISKQTKKGNSYPDIEAHLIKHGWRREDARQAINQAKGEEALESVSRKKFYEKSLGSGDGKPVFVHSNSSLALMLTTILIAAVVVGAGIFYMSNGFLTGMAAKQNEKQPYTEAAKEVSAQEVPAANNLNPASIPAQMETKTEAYAFNPGDWLLVSGSDAQIKRLTKDRASITISQLNSNNLDLVDYFDSVLSVVQSLEGQSGDHVLKVSDEYINGRKAKKLLRQYEQDGAAIKLQQVYMEYNGFIYLVNYEADAETFDKNLGSANQVIESIEFNR